MKSYAPKKNAVQYLKAILLPFAADGQQRRVQARREEVGHVHRGRGAVQRARGGAHDAGRIVGRNRSRQPIAECNTGPVGYSDRAGKLKKCHC